MYIRHKLLSACVKYSISLGRIGLLTYVFLGKILFDFLYQSSGTVSLCGIYVMHSYMERRSWYHNHTSRHRPTSAGGDTGIFWGNSWWRHQMETFSALLPLCGGNSPFTVEFPTQRPVTRSFYTSFDLGLNKRLSKQSWRRWFETPSRLLWVIVMQSQFNT